MEYTATLSSVGTLNANLNPSSSVGVLDARLSTAFIGGEVKSYDSIFDFPNRGDADSLYISTKDNSCYRWDGENSKYFCVGRDYEEIEVIICGGSA